MLNTVFSGRKMNTCCPSLPLSVLPLICCIIENSDVVFELIDSTCRNNGVWVMNGSLVVFEGEEECTSAAFNKFVTLA